MEYSTLHEFSITLPSNVKNNGRFGENSISNYKTLLKHRINLNPQDNWQVGLAQIIYSMSWFNVKKSYRIEFFLIDGSSFTDYKKSKSWDNIDQNEEPLTIHEGYYVSISELVSVINKKLSVFKNICDDEKSPHLLYEPFTRRVKLFAGVFEKIVFFPTFGEEIEEILGLSFDKVSTLKKRSLELDKNIVEANMETNILTNLTTIVNNAYQNKIYKGVKIAELNAGLQSLFVYCDIVEPNLVGDTSAQLLRVVEIPPKSEFGEPITLNYDRPHFIPIQKCSFDTVEIDIKDDLGENIDFQYGRVLIKLILRKYGRLNQS